MIMSCDFLLSLHDPLHCAMLPECHRHEWKCDWFELLTLQEGDLVMSATSCTMKLLMVLVRTRWPPFVLIEQQSGVVLDSSSVKQRTETGGVVSVVRVCCVAKARCATPDIIIVNIGHRYYCCLPTSTQTGPSFVFY